ncbi:hypothetical protein [Engelhardtia mirabilis]|uniref:Uncharacterized protein n=1 Tax=Engelhardtia mirabilis TaxID=2528011 RepID=A0A518BEZ3_9BACT|nr:hypothetical protein Pla133_06230 [Planctomycetes bacterium Pla133]QDU99883.1 hypothetical protein Pla86_06220 [Planctomycetes bacterium Pla86]
MALTLLLAITQVSSDSVVAATGAAYIEVLVQDQRGAAVPNAKVYVEEPNGGLTELPATSHNSPYSLVNTQWSGAIVVPWAGRALVPTLIGVDGEGIHFQEVWIDPSESQWLVAEAYRDYSEERSSAQAVTSFLQGYNALLLGDTTLHYQPQLLPDAFTAVFTEHPRGAGGMDKSGDLASVRWSSMQMQIDVALFDLNGMPIDTSATPFIIEYRQSLPVDAYGVADVRDTFKAIEAQPEGHNSWLKGWRLDSQASQWYQHTGVSFNYDVLDNSFLMSVPGLSSWTVVGDLDELGFLVGTPIDSGPVVPGNGGMGPPTPSVPEIDMTKSCTTLGEGDKACDDTYSGPTYTISKGSTFDVKVSAGISNTISAQFGLKGSGLTKFLVDIEGSLGSEFTGTLSGATTSTATMAVTTTLESGKTIAKDVLPCSKGPVKFVMVNQDHSIAGISLISVPLYPSVTYKLAQSDVCCQGVLLSSAPCCDLHEYKSVEKACGQ